MYSFLQISLLSLVNSFLVFTLDMAIGLFFPEEFYVNIRIAAQVDKSKILDRIRSTAEVAELADALRSGRSEPWAHEGSTPSFGIIPQLLCGIFNFKVHLYKMVQ